MDEMVNFDWSERYPDFTMETQPSWPGRIYQMALPLTPALQDLLFRYEATKAAYDAVQDELARLLNY